MKDLKRNGPDGLSGAFKVEGHFVVDEPNNKILVDCPVESLSVVPHIRNVMGGLKEADDTREVGQPYFKSKGWL